ncbi:MAG: serine/threonine protein kinase [Deltaproteobacteria bacterium]|nr:serine/threonine protein kinase [Deltaproteobacteria bacterium]
MVGERYGNYQAIALLGEGGMGAVYLAEHPGIGRKVAIKVLRSEMDHDPQLLTRFLNEARAANAIRHPNIIEVLDSGTTDKGASYLVMELLEGEALSARLRRLSRLDEKSAIEIAMQTALGLGAAHAKGITHRDLKPDNLFIIPEPADASRERVKILDFGIAKLHKLAGDSLKTRTGTLMGTPIYMSPEQCLGTREVDHRSDVYSLGVILYEMLAGQPPFLSEGFGELLSMHLHELPAPLRQFAPQVTAQIEEVVRRMLAKKPDDRYQSMTDVRTALATAGQLPNTVSPEHKIGNTDKFGGARTLAADSGEPKPNPLAPTTLTPGGMAHDALADGTLKVRGKPWLAIAIGTAVVAAALVLAVALRNKPAAPPAAKRPVPAAKPPAPPPPTPPQMIRVRLESTPAGARVVRVTDGAVLGTTPTTIEVRSTPKPMLVRVEKEGFAATTREISLAAHGEVSVALEAIPAAPAEKPSAKPRRRGGPKPQPAEDRNEPAKL